MEYLYLFVFVVLTIIHLIATKKHNKALRDVTKGFILFSLLGFYLQSVGSQFSLFVVLAIVFSWIGDLLLIPKGVKWFTLGGISFMISHIFFILSYNERMDITLVPIYAIILIALFFYSLSIIIFKNMNKYLKKFLFYTMLFYLLINATMNCFAMFRLIASFGINSLITAIGAILFYISDSLLFYVRFNTDTKQKSHFGVMITYSLGELLIVLGLIL